MQPWQIFHAARVALTPERVGKIFNRGARAAYDWAQDPATTQVRCRSPLELLHTLFEELELVGRGYVARAACAYLLSALDGGEVPERVKEPHRNMSVELLRDFAAVATLQRAIDAGADLAEVRALANEAKDEIDRTVACAARNYKDEGTT
ncbi:MAG: hypothetical protein ACOX5Z_00070 [Desulfobulbus sp.]